MRTRICDEFGIEYPIFGFTPSPEVAAAITKAGGMGVLGAVRYNDPADLADALDWMDANTDGKPYGVDVVMPMKIPTEGTPTDLGELIPEAHRKWVDDTLLKLGVPPLPDATDQNEGVLGWLHSVARSHVDVALEHPIKLIANALGSPPQDVIDRVHKHGVKVAALAGKTVHAERHVSWGVDIVVAQGHEAGGHTGEIASMVLWPEIVDALSRMERSDSTEPPFVLGAGGIGTGRQVAAALALGCDGVWMGSTWLTAEENQMMQQVGATTKALLRATSADTVRARVYTGKPARLLKTKWTQAWEEEGAPEPLPMPLQNLLVAEAHQRIMLSNDPDVVSMPVGQIVGRMNEIRPVATIMDELITGYDEAVERMGRAR
jgi:NAD(P)H-dependent flavin oxidoreductase YrpB (nitropropane dioxygenase family)